MKKLFIGCKRDGSKATLGNAAEKTALPATD
jgi:hypothetical protein